MNGWLIFAIFVLIAPLFFGVITLKSGVSRLTLPVFIAKNFQPRRHAIFTDFQVAALHSDVDFAVFFGVSFFYRLDTTARNDTLSFLGRFFPGLFAKNIYPFIDIGF